MASIMAAFWQLITNPRDNAAALVVGKKMLAMATAQSAANTRAQMETFPEVRQIIDERYMPKPYECQELIGYETGTLGHAYHTFMVENGLQTISPPIPVDSDANYVRLRSLQTHDLWHLVADYGLDTPSEAALQAFYLGQGHGMFGAVLISAALMHAALFAPDMLAPMMRGIGEGYLRGCKAKPLFAVKWEEMWARPLAQVRADLGIAEPPTFLNDVSVKP